MQVLLSWKNDGIVLCPPIIPEWCHSCESSSGNWVNGGLLSLTMWINQFERFIIHSCCILDIWCVEIKTFESCGYLCQIWMRFLSIKNTITTNLTTNNVYSINMFIFSRCEIFSKERFISNYPGKHFVLFCFVLLCLLHFVIFVKDICYLWKNGVRKEIQFETFELFLFVIYAVYDFGQCDNHIISWCLVRIQP